jgi:hypothetical protein
MVLSNTSSEIGWWSDSENIMKINTCNKH